MCGRFTLSTNFETLMDRFEIDAAFEESDYHISYNIAPTQQVVSVINDGMKNRMGYLKWGLVPNWSKDEKIGYKLINARAETLYEIPSFRNAFQKRRCLIIADSFYEWKKTPERKIPMRIKLKSNEPFAMAGLWESWKSPLGNTIFSCTIITTKANSFMSTIHERMPLIVKPEDEKLWLNPRNSPNSLFTRIIQPYADDLIEAYEVSSDVNSTKNNNSDLIKEIS